MTAAGPRSRLGARIALAVILVGTVALRARLLALPLERDEGEYAYLGQLILHGDVPYLAAHNMKLPGTYYAYAAILGALGETDVAIRLGLLAINLGTILLVHRLGRRLVDDTAGLVAAAGYAILSLGPSVLGFTANAEHFVLLPAVAGALVLAGADGRRDAARTAAAGVLFGLAYVMKQPGAAFVVFGALERATRPDGGRARHVGILLLAATIPFALTCLGMWALGAFAPFWFWTVTYAREYVSQISLDVGLAHLATVGGAILASAPVWWLLVGIGVTTPAWDARARGTARFLGLFAACSAAAVCPGLRFSEHYFLLLLPAASLLAGLAVSALARATPAPGLVAAGLPALALATALVADRAALLELAPEAVSRRVYGVNPFPEAREIGRYLDEHAAPGERIAVIGSEPEIYFYARRRAATSYIYTYPLMEPHPFARRMQDEMVAQLEHERPRFLVLVNVDTSWSRRPDSPRTLFDWAERTVNDGFAPVGVVEIPPDGPSVFRWGDAALALPRTAAHVVVFERRDPLPGPAGPG